MKRAAITGITGQDGTYLARSLLRLGYEVHGLLRSPFDRIEANLRRRFGNEDVSKISWHYGSLEDPFSLVRFLKSARPDEIYHLAGLTDSRQSFNVPEETVFAITLGTLRILEASREICETSKIFLASSCEIFGVPREFPQNEKTPRQPVTPYGIAKLSADQFARLHREKYGRFVTIGILYNHESPLRSRNYLSSRVARAVAEIKKGRSRGLELGDLNAERDWSDARDFVQGFHLSLQAKTPGEYVFASGKTRRVSDLVDCAFRAAGLDYREFVTMTNRNEKSRQVAAGLCGNSSKAETELRWKREWDFEKTIEDMVRAELEDRSESDRSKP
ncbi:MAG TPA: GDP-mannose 4,6-dehydratase, partial [Verrucomicrobiae bacterium]|nr:GDP-mannose 4,6-dehydratase [Verrucomicrobiae bacterium]